MNDVTLPRLLVVDDEAAHLDALCDVLGANGYETTGCASGEDALQALAGASFDLLLTDINMPGIDGMELLRRALAVDPSLAGVIMTGKGSIDTAIESMQSGAIDYIVKPFKLSVVLPVLERALEMRRLRSEKAALALQVRQQLEELKIANADLEAFSASVSHDLRAPLHVIGGFAGLLQQRHAGQLDAAGLAYLGRIRGAVSEMSKLIEGLLNLSRLGRKPLHREAVDVRRLVLEVTDNLRHSGALCSAEVTVADPLPQAWADPVLLRQVWANLLSNACKFSGRTPHAQVAAGALAVENGQPVYFVRDNGAGFDPARAAKMFEPFQRLHSADEFQGIGLGLSIVQRIVTRHGGRVWAESAPGEGATFYFTVASEG